MNMKSSNYTQNDVMKLSAHWSKTQVCFLRAPGTTEAHGNDHPQTDAAQVPATGQEERNKLQLRK